MNAVRVLLGAVLALLLVGCEASPAPPKFPPIEFSHLSPIRLNVGRIEVVNEYRPPLRAPNVEHLFPVTPAAAAERWVRDRLRAMGQAGTARIIIRQASVVEVKLKKKTGLKGALTVDQSERYDGELDIQIELRSEQGLRNALVQSVSKQRRSVPEDISVNDRDKIFYEITKTLIGNADTVLEREIRANFGRWLQ